jgi:hypothetical protein
MKKEIPLRLIQVVEGFIKENSQYIENEIENDSYYLLKDRDPNSKFFFKIHKEFPKNINYGGKYPAFAISIKPKSETVIKEHLFVTDFPSLSTFLNNWITLIKAYDNTPSVFDDPVLNKFQKDFYEECKIMEDDADYAPFNTLQLIFLDEYLSSFITKIQDQNEFEQEFKQEVIKDAENIKESLTTMPKNEVIKKITSIWAKIQKKGLKYAKEFVITAKNEFIKMIVRKGLDAAGEITKGAIELLQ